MGKPEEGVTWAKRLVSRLYRDLGSVRGRIRRVTEAAGVHADYPRERAAAGTMDLLSFCCLILASGKDLPTFVSETLGNDPVRSLIKDPPCAEPAVIAQARARAVSDDPGTIGRAYLERLDDLRYDDPGKARDRVTMVLEDIAPQDVPFALGVYASCCRPLLQHDHAWKALVEGMRLAEQQGAVMERARLLQRVSVLHLIECSFDLALAASEKASICYLHQGSLPGLGQTLVDQGTILWDMGRGGAAETAFRQSLAFLEPANRRHLFYAHHSLAFLRYVGKEPDAGLKMLEVAAPLASGKTDVGKLHWVKGLCLEALNRTEEALKDFDEAIKLLTVTAPADAALLICHVVRMLLHLDMPGTAQRYARLMFPLTETVGSESRRVETAIRDLALAGLESVQRLDVALVESVIREMKKARKRKPAGRVGSN